MGAASSVAPSYDFAFKKTRAAPSSLPPSARPPRTARARANGPAFPPMQRVRTASRRASSTPIARKRAPRMTPLQTSSDLLGRRLGKASRSGAFHTEERRRPRRRLGGGVLCAPVGAARFTSGVFQAPTPERRGDRKVPPPSVFSGTAGRRGRRRGSRSSFGPSGRPGRTGRNRPST